MILALEAMVRQIFRVLSRGCGGERLMVVREGIARSAATEPESTVSGLLTGCRDVSYATVRIRVFWWCRCAGEIYGLTGDGFLSYTLVVV